MQHNPSAETAPALTLSACERRCPLCGGDNACGARNTEASQPCWCTTVTFSPTLLTRVPAPLQRKACICQACATADPSRPDSVVNAVSTVSAA